MLNKTRLQEAIVENDVFVIKEEVSRLASALLDGQESSEEDQNELEQSLSLAVIHGRLETMKQLVEGVFKTRKKAVPPSIINLAVKYGRPVELLYLLTLGVQLR